MDLKDITDSREILEARPHPFLAWFIYILIALITVALIWACCSEIDEYVKATGSVRPSEKISTIRNPINGKVKQVAMFEGMQVKQGDLLYTIDINNMLIQQSESQRLISQLELETDQLNKFHGSIIQEKNLFDPNNQLEIEYYNRVQKYLNDLLLNKEQINNNRLDFEQMKVDVQLSTQLTEARLAVAQTELTNLETLLKSVEQEKNLFTDSNPEFHNRYENYQIHLAKLNGIFQQHKETHAKYKRLLASGGTTRNEVIAAELQMNSAKLDIDKYTRDYRLNLQENIKQTNINITELTNSLEKWQHSINSYHDRTQSIELMIEKNKLDTIVQIEEQIANNRHRLDSLYNDLSMLENSIADGIVKAPIDGVVNIILDITSGDLVLSGTEIAVIVPDNSDYSMQLLIQNPDIANVNIDQKIRYRFHALPYQEYGELEGAIRTIGADARIDNLSGMSFYLAEATVSETFLENHAGHVEHIKVGMAFDAYVVTTSKPVIRWLLEKLNFID